jgi:hypothetical protein
LAKQLKGLSLGGAAGAKKNKNKNKRDLDSESDSDIDNNEVDRNNNNQEHVSMDIDMVGGGSTHLTKGIKKKTFSRAYYNELKKAARRLKKA